MIQYFIHTITFSYHRLKILDGQAASFHLKFDSFALNLSKQTRPLHYIYLHADQKLKEQAMEMTTPLGIPVQRYQPKDSLLAYLNSL